MQSHFNNGFFVGNRQRLREIFTGTAPIVVTANGQLQRGRDSGFPLAQEANFWYLTGIDEPDIILVMDRDKEYLIVPTRSAVRQAFDGQVDHEALSKRSGVETVYDDKAGWLELSTRLQKVKHAATVAAPPAYLEQYGLYTNPARAQLVERLKGYKPGLKLLDITPHLTKLRMIKQPVELTAMQAAIDMTIESMRSLIRGVKAGKYNFEYEVEADLSREFRRRGADHGFDPIVASGPRACTLHNVANNGRLGKGELLLIDTGAQAEHYSADLTRTLCLGKATKRQQAVHQAVLEVQQFALSLLKPGLLMRDYEQQIEHFMGEKLRELNLIKKVDHKQIRKYYPHATSHFLGINVHDVGDYNRPLEAGVVLTVEPGIYIPKEGIGIRIEDDVLITAKGHQVLSNKLSRELA